MKKDYLITQKPLSALTLFALPMILGNLFQQLYTIVDSAIVGKFVGEDALAAVGASYALTNIFICIAIGGGIGASVLVSRYFGNGNIAAMKKSAFTAFIAFFVLSVVIAIVGYFCSRVFMVALKTPAEALDMAVEYLKIYFLGLPFLFMYNVVSSMFNALGRSTIPLVFLVCSSLANMVLDYVFVVYCGLGVAGVAWATLIAQGVSAILSFVIFFAVLKKYEGKADKVFDFAELKGMTRIALPSVFQQSTVSIGMLLVQSVINGFGTEALAGFSAAMRIESLCVVPFAAIGNAVSAYTAQNLGAGQTQRVKKGYLAANLLVAIFSVAICLFLELGNRFLISIFLEGEGTQVAMQTGCGYLSFMGWFFVLIGVKMAVDGLLRGAGDMPFFTIANLVNLTIRVVMAICLAPSFGIQWVWIAVPIGWFANFLISFVQFMRGKWKEKGKDTEEAVQ